MNKLVGVALVAWSLMASLPAIGSAQSEDGRRLDNNRTNADGPKKPLRSNWRRWEYRRGEEISEVPELDAGVARSAIALLLAASALVLERRRRAASA